MKNSNQNKESNETLKKEPTQAKPVASSSNEQSQTEKAKVKQAAKETSQEVLASDESPI